jgi:hypothetical protein
MSFRQEFNATKNIPQGLKPALIPLALYGDKSPAYRPIGFLRSYKARVCVVVFVARLKSCPFKTKLLPRADMPSSLRYQ